MTSARPSLRQRLAAAFRWQTDEFGRMQDLSGMYADADLLRELGPALGDS